MVCYRSAAQYGTVRRNFHHCIACGSAPPHMIGYTSNQTQANNDKQLMEQQQQQQHFLDEHTASTLAEELRPTLSVVASQWLRAAPPAHQVAAALNEYVDRVSQSATRGQLGEQHVLDLLAKEWAVRRVSAHKACSGDLWLQDHNVLVEVKASRRRAVPQSEVDKCVRDMEHQRPDAAVLLSLTSGVANVGALPCVAIQWVGGGGGIPLVVCASDHDELLRGAVRVACVLAKRVRMLRAQGVRSNSGGGCGVVPTTYRLAADACARRMQTIVCAMGETRRALEQTSVQVQRAMQTSLVGVQCAEQQLLDVVRLFEADCAAL